MRRFACHLTLAALTLTPGLALAAPKIGSKIEEKTSSLKSMDDGGAKLLQSLTKAKQPRVLVFVSARCPFVKKALKPLADLAKQYGDKVQFVGVNANQSEPMDEVKKDAGESFKFPILVDDGSKLADAFEAEHTPEAYLVDAEGVLRYHGGVEDLGAALAAFTAGKPIKKAESKAIGCGIKRSK